MATQHKRQVFPANSGVLVGIAKNGQSLNVGALPNGPAGALGQKSKEPKNHKSAARNQNSLSYNEKSSGKRIA